MSVVCDSHVLLDCPAKDTEEALTLIAEKAVELGMADDADALREALAAREAAGTTGMMGGFAIPHAKADAVKQSGVIVVKFAGDVAWDSQDGQPITCAIALLNPASEVSAHLAMLSKVAALLMDEGFRSKIQASSDPAEIAAAVNEGLDAE